MKYSLLVFVIFSFHVNAQNNTFNLSKDIKINFSNDGLVQINSVKNKKDNHYFDLKFHGFSLHNSDKELVSPISTVVNKNTIIYNWTNNIIETWAINNYSIQRTIRIKSSPTKSDEQSLYSLQSFVDTDLTESLSGVSHNFNDDGSQFQTKLSVNDGMFSIIDDNCKQLATSKTYDDINQLTSYHLDIKDTKFPLTFKQYLKVNVKRETQQINKIKINGNVIAVSYTNPIQVNIYKKVNNSWQLSQEIKTSHLKGFGNSLALNENTLAIGSPYEEVRKKHNELNLQKLGVVYIYTGHNNKWQLSTKISDGKVNTMEGHFGASLYLKNNTLVVGAPDTLTFETGTHHNYKINDQEGAVFIYENDNGNWTTKAVLLPKKDSNESAFGKTIAIDKNTLIIAGNYIDTNHFYNPLRKSRFNQKAIDFGQFYIYEQINNKWQMVKRFKLHDINRFRPRDSDITFADSLDISNGTIVVSSAGKTWAFLGIDNSEDGMDNEFDESGNVYVISKKKKNKWQVIKKLKARIPQDWDHFGNVVKINNDTIIVGVNGESSNFKKTTGIHKNCNAKSSGAAYIFKHSIRGWNKSNYLKGNSPIEFDKFSQAIDFDGENIAIASKTEIYVYSQENKKWKSVMF